MTFIQEPTEYSFNASALGVGGYFTRDGKRVLVPSLASVALAPGGGEGFSRVTNYDQDDISFTHAESRVAGYPTSARRFTTYSDILITNLSVWGTFKVAMLQATVTSSRDLDSDDEATFHLHATYRGVEAGGYEIVPELDIEICQGSSYVKMVEGETPQADTDAGLPAVAKGAVVEMDPEERARIRRKKAMERGEPIRTTILRDLKAADHLAKGGRGGRNNILHVPEFANVHFGELLVKPGRRRVNLLRFDFGAKLDAQFARGAEIALAARTLDPNSGTLTVGSGDGNGDPVWPRG